MALFGANTPLAKWLLGNGLDSWLLAGLLNARTGAYFSTAPFIDTALSVLLLNDSVSVPLLIAAGLMGIGAYLHLTEHHEHEHAHESL